MGSIAEGFVFGLSAATKRIRWQGFKWLSQKPFYRCACVGVTPYGCRKQRKLPVDEVRAILCNLNSRGYLQVFLNLQKWSLKYNQISSNKFSLFLKQLISCDCYLTVTEP